MPTWLLGPLQWHPFFTFRITGCRASTGFRSEPARHQAPLFYVSGVQASWSVVVRSAGLMEVRACEGFPVSSPGGAIIKLISDKLRIRIRSILLQLLRMHSLAITRAQKHPGLFTLTLLRCYSGWGSRIELVYAYASVQAGVASSSYSCSCDLSA